MKNASPSKRPRVIIRRCPEYDPTVIEKIVREGIAELGLADKIKGRVTIKPNVVMAHHKIAPSGYTRPEFIEGVVRGLRSSGAAGLKIAIAEKCGAGLPTSRMFRRAGYYRLQRKLGVRLRPIEEARKARVALSRGVVHRRIVTARDIVDNDILVYTPKLKTNYLSHGLTGSIKLNIGLLRDRERMWNHNDKLDDKIVDLLEVGYPDVIATDAIEIAMGGNQFTQHGRRLGVILLSDHPLAHDVVAAHIFHLDPNGIGHLARAAARGYGSLSLSDIDIQGDIPLEEVRNRTKDWEVGFIRVERAHPNITVLCGEPYCTGGCHGVFLDWLYMIKDRKPKLWARLPRWTVVIGPYKGDVVADKVFLLGTCTRVEGRVRAKRIIRLRGCPPKHKKLVLGLFLKAGIVNPLMRLDLIFDGYVFLFFSWLRRLAKGRL